MNFNFGEEVNNFNSNYENLLKSFKSHKSIKFNNKELNNFNNSYNSIINEIINMNGGFKKNNEEKQLKTTLYHAKWCGHCRTFKPIWDEIMKNYKDNKNISFEDYEEQDMTPTQLKNVKYFPTILFNNTLYDGGRSFEEFNKEIKNRLN